MGIIIECANYMFGPACNRSCGNCRKREDCHHINGSCLSGCKAGYQGEKCMKGTRIHVYLTASLKERQVISRASFWYLRTIICVNLDLFIVCDYGFHGPKCLKECSKFCKTTQDCHPITGTCHGGCRSGWQGHDCLDGHYHISYIDKKLYIFF